MTGLTQNIPTVSGTWTPANASSDSVTFSSVSAGYTRVGNMVFVYGTLTFPDTTGLTQQVSIGGLPFTIASASYGLVPGAANSTLAATPIWALPVNNTTTFQIRGSGLAAVTNLSMSTRLLVFNFAYPIA